MKIVINHTYEQLRSFIDNIPYFFNNKGNPVYTGRNELKSYNVEGVNLIVKSFKKPHFINRIVYTFFRPSKAKRSYEYALEMRKRNIPTPDPIAYIEIREKGLLKKSYYVSIFEKDFSEIRRQMLGEYDEQFLKDLAYFISELHSKGILQKDLSPGNILTKTYDNKNYFTLVDINRTEFINKIPLKKRYKNFERISEKREIIDNLAKEYAKISHLDEEESIREINKYIARYSKNYPT